MDLIDLTELIIKTHKLDPDLQLKKPIRGLNGFTTYELLHSILITDNIKNAAKLLGYTENPIKQAIRGVLLPVFQHRHCEFGSGDSKASPPWKFELLNSIGYKHCGYCNEVLPSSDFGSDASSSDKLNGHCKICSILKSKKYKYNISIRTPTWSDLLRIREIYKNCPEGMHVDHIIPLNGKYVSGLHVPDNLQYLHELDNISKGNRIDLDAYNKKHYGT